MHCYNVNLYEIRYSHDYKKVDVATLNAKPFNLSEIYIYFEINCPFTLKMEAANCPETGIFIVV